VARRGKALERLVAVIERAAHNRPNVTVQSPAKLKDWRTARLREHDVLLSFEEAHHTIHVALECRDRARPIGVPDVEAFQNKCADTGIDRGIIVSSSGFCSSALKKAASCNIGCLSMDDAKVLDWCATSGITIYDKVIQDGQLEWIADVRASEAATLFTQPGVPFDGNTAFNILKHAVSKVDLIPDADASYLLRFNLTIPGPFLLEPDGTRVPVSRARAWAKVLVRVRLAPFETRIYRDAAAKRDLYSTAVANIDLGSAEGSIVVLHKEGEGASVAWVPNTSVLNLPGKKN
jgi:hypothetical protein